MARRFFIWADANCNGENVEWVEMTGKEYQDFKKNPANKKRRLIRLTDHYSYESDVLYFEVTECDYQEWVSEYQHSLYLMRDEQKIFKADIDESLDTLSNEQEWDYSEIERTTDFNYFFEVLEELKADFTDDEKLALKILEDKEFCQIKIDVSLQKYGMSRRQYNRKILEIRKKLKKLCLIFPKNSTTT